jgi:nucleoid-associated protein YgaU
MPAGLKVGLVAGLAVAVGFVLWAVNQSGDATKTELPFDSSVKRGDSKTQLAQDVAKSFNNAGSTDRTPIATIPPRNAPKKAVDSHNQPAVANRQPESPTRSGNRSINPGALDPKPPARESGEQVPAPKRRDTAAPEIPSAAGDDPAAHGARKPNTIGAAQPGDQPLEPKVGGTKPETKTTNSGETITTPKPAANDPPKAPEQRRTVPSPPATPGQTVHAVVQQDTLTFIAAQYYTDENLWPAIKLANPGIDENKLRIGQKIVVPTEAEAKRMLARQASGGAPKTPATDAPARTPQPVASGSTSGTGSLGDLIYVVESDDSLIKIARKVLGDGNRWKEIFELNKDQLASADQIQVGMKLKMPKK